MAVVDLTPLMADVSNCLSEERQRNAICKMKETLGERYSNETNLSELLQKLVQHGRIGPADLYVLENCLGPAEHEKSRLNALISDFKDQHRDEISKIQAEGSFKVERKDIYDQIETAMRRENNSRFRGMLLYGKAGAGKSFLAKEYICSEKERKVVYIDLRGINNVIALLIVILRKFGHVVAANEADLKIFQSKLKKIKTETILFMDNAEMLFDLEKTQLKAEIGISSIIRAAIDSCSGKIKVLVTSRKQSNDTEICDVLRQQEVGPLQEELAKYLLRSVKGHAEHSEENKSEKEIEEAADVCKFLPLNLSLFGGMMKTFGKTIGRVLDIVKKCAGKESKKVFQNKEKLKENEIRVDTESILQASFDQLSDTMQSGAVALSLYCTPFTAADVQFIFGENFDACKLKLILHALRYTNIIYEEGGRYDMHPEVRSYLKTMKDANEHIAKFYHEAKRLFLEEYRRKLVIYAREMIKDYEKAYNNFQDEYANFESAFNQHVDEGVPLFESFEDLQASLSLLGVMFRKKWRAKFFQRLAQSNIDKGNKSLGALYLCQSAYIKAYLDPSDALIDIYSADYFLKQEEKDQEKTDKPKAELRAIRSLYYEALGNCFYSIAQNSQHKTDINLAVTSYEECCKMREEGPGDGSRFGLVSAYSGLGACYSMQAQVFMKDDTKGKSEKLDKALKYYEKSLGFTERRNVADVNTPNTLQNIAAAYQLKGEFREAKRRHKEALHYEEKHKMNGFYTTATIKFNLANVYRELTNHTSALKFAREALKIREELLECHPSTVQSLYQIAVIYYEKTNYEAAFNFFIRAFDLEEELPENRHSCVRQDIRKYMEATFEILKKPWRKIFIPERFLKVNEAYEERKTRILKLETEDLEREARQTAAKKVKESDGLVTSELHISKDVETALSKIEMKQLSCFVMEEVVKHVILRLKERKGYPMQHIPHGLCVIFSNENFDGNSKREGNEFDVAALENTFRWLEFTVDVQQDKKAEEIREKLTNLSKDIDHKNYDAFICCVLSHGGKDVIFGTDGKEISIQEIRNKFKGNRKGLDSKPKVFFIQACRGVDKDFGHLVQIPLDVDKERQHCNEANSDALSTLGRESIESLQKSQTLQTSGEGSDIHIAKIHDKAQFDLDVPSMKMKISTELPEVNDRSQHPKPTLPDDCDFLFAYGTTPGNKAIRRPDAGSWFVPTLCDQLQKHAREEDLESILTSVVDEMKKMRSDGRYKATAEKHSNLSKKFFFYPQKPWDA